MRYIPECRCKRCGKTFSPIPAAISVQGLIEIATREVQAAPGDTPPAIYIHSCDDGGKGIGDLVGAALTVRADKALRPNTTDGGGHL